MVDYGLKDTTSWCQQRIKVGLTKNRSFRALIKGQSFGLEDVGLELIEVDVVVELDNINFLWRFMLRVQRHLDVDPRDAAGLGDIHLPTT